MLVEALSIALVALVSGAAGAVWGARHQRKPNETNVSAPLPDATPPTDHAEAAVVLAIRRALSLASRHRRPVSVVEVRVDTVNPLPTELIQALDGFMHSRLRVHDVVVHTGPVRWTLVLPDTDAGGALIVAEDLRTGVAPLKGPGLAALSLSLGVHGRDGTADPDAPTEVLNKCRAAADAAQAQGGNRVEIEP